MNSDPGIVPLVDSARSGGLYYMRELIPWWEIAICGTDGTKWSRILGVELGSMGHVEGRIMDEDAQAHIRARSHLQSGSAVSWRLPKIVCGPKYPGLKCLKATAHSPQTVGWPGLAKPAGSCTTHEESFITSFGSESGDERSFRVWDTESIPNPWWYNLTIDEKFGNKKYKADGGEMPYQNGNTEKSIGNFQRIVLRT